MDFRFTPEQEAFRQDLRAFLKEELPPDWRWDMLTEDESQFQFGRHFCKRLAQKGWVAPAWPKEYGGMGADLWTQVVYAEEMAYHNAPLSPVTQGVTNVGPTVIAYGTQEQKREHLPGITSAEVTWAQGYSEPNAGSDLANIETRATKDGEGYIINGHKIWTSFANQADWTFVLARTDPSAPKHRGISYFLFPLKLPGIRIKPLVNLAGGIVFNEMFFDNVRVPQSALLGEENRGFYIAMYTLTFERSWVGQPDRCRRLLDDLIAYCKETKVNDRPLIKDPLVRRRLAEMAIEIEMGRLLSYQVVSAQSPGADSTRESNVSRVFNGEMAQRLARFGMQLLGLYGQLRPESQWSRLGGRLEAECLTSTGLTIAGGTCEIARNVVAVRGLDLPR